MLEAAPAYPKAGFELALAYDFSTIVTVRQSAIQLEATAQDKFQIQGAAVIEFDAAKNQMVIKRRGGQERVLTKEK